MYDPFSALFKIIGQFLNKNKLNNKCVHFICLNLYSNLFILTFFTSYIVAMLMYERQRCEFRVVLQKRARRLQERKVDNLQRTKELQEVIFYLVPLLDSLTTYFIFYNNLFACIFKKHITNLEELARNIGCSEETLRDCKPRCEF